jgi:RNA polymerase primary sigma factor
MMNTQAQAHVGEPLERYFSGLSQFPLLDAKGEVALAREIERLELDHWRALFSYRPAFEVAAGAVQADLPARSRKLEAIAKRVRSRRRHGTHPGTRDARLAAALRAAACELRELDLNGSALTATDAAVRKAFGAEPRAQRYLARLGRARAAQQRAKGRFVAANLRLVISMARRYERSLLPLADLIQEGNLGLMQAVERFDYRRGFRFSTYAAWWIRHSLNRALSDKARLVRVPVHALDLAARVGRASAAITSRTGLAPTLAELAIQTGLSEDKLARLRAEAVTRLPISLDGNPGDEGDSNLHEVLQDPEQTDPDYALDLASWHDSLQRNLKNLPPIEAAILRLRFGLDGEEEQTLREIGLKYDLSRERIRQLQQQALTRLRQTLAAA